MTALPNNKNLISFENMDSCLLLFIVVIAAIGRIYQLDVDSLWADELWGVEFCSRGWWAMIDNLINKDSHPPGYQTMLYFWMKMLGDSDFMVRLPSVIAGVMSIWALLRFARLFFSPFVSLLACTLLACSYNAILYSQEARAYSFILWFAIWYFDNFLKIFLLNRKDVLTRIQFFLSGVLLIYFHYVGVVLLLGSVLLVPLLQPFSKNTLKLLLLAFVPFFLSYIVWLPAFTKHLLHSDPTFWTPVPGWPKLVETWRFILGPDHLRFYSGIAAILVFLAIAFVKKRRHEMGTEQRIGLLMLLFCVIPLAAFFLQSQFGASSYTVRHFVYIIPFTCVLIAWVVEYSFVYIGIPLTQRNIMICIAAFILLWTYLNTTSTLRVGGKLYTEVRKIEYREAVRVIVRDTDFMKGPRHIFASNLFFDYYLKHMFVSLGAEKQWHWDLPERITEYADDIKKANIDEFYYLEVMVDPVTKAPSPLLKKLQERYYTVCQSQYVWSQAVKFSTRLPPKWDEEIPRCPRTIY